MSIVINKAFSKRENKQKPPNQLASTPREKSTTNKIITIKKERKQTQNTPKQNL
jgi:hypothetical protein